MSHNKPPHAPWVKPLTVNPSFKWRCSCIPCGFNYIWVVRAGFMQVDRQGVLAIDMNFGSPIFWNRGKPDSKSNRFGPDWMDDISEGNHYLSKEDGEVAATEAVLFYPFLIGNVDVLQFRIR